MGLRSPSRGFYVIIFEGRTGSSYTVSALNQHPNVFCYPEVLARCNQMQQRELLDALILGKSITHINPYAEDPMYGARFERSHEVGGFKVKLNDVYELEKFLDYLERHKFKLIYLKRQNILKSAISWMNARRLRRQYGFRWNPISKSEVQGALYIDPDVLLDELAVRIRYERWHETFYDAYAGKKRIFYYENLMQNEARFFGDMFGFLEVARHPVRGTFFKNTPDQLHEAVINYDEIRDLCVDTYFERFLDD